MTQLVLRIDGNRFERAFQAAIVSPAYFKSIVASLVIVFAVLRAH
jgi:hypothetical protein